MINRIAEFFIDRRAKAKTGARHSVDEFHLAAAALLVEAAGIDHEFHEIERGTVLSVVAARFGLAPDEAQSLIAAAENAVGEASQLLGFTRAIKDGFSYEERVQLLESLWEVVYADGVLDAFESTLMRRIGGLLYVEDRDRGLARQRVRARLGIVG